jgi:carbamoyl-phosphate synthase small subunit
VTRPMVLRLADGTEWRGVSFGADVAVAGEVVFNTAMYGYVETLTDPSYRGQILITTWPLVGNYGVPADRPAGSLVRPFESDRVQVQGLVVQGYSPDPSHHTSARSLGAWLKAHNVPAITGIDTRALTRRLREHGTVQGWIVPDEGDIDGQIAKARAIDMTREVFTSVTPDETTHLGEAGPTVLVIDSGCKDGIVRCLLDRGARVVRAPFTADLPALAAHVDGIMMGNGPGDPKDLGDLIAQVRVLLQGDTPIFGVCLGHQILALAAGADTYKLPYGHRGVNQPVQDLYSRRCLITSQNHGYAVDDRTLPAGWEPWFLNTNDGTNEGLRCINKPFSSVQFHPEACPGPQDAAYLFDDFLARVSASSGIPLAPPRLTSAPIPEASTAQEVR